MNINMIPEVMNPNMTTNVPDPGTCATMYVGSDRYAMVVTEVISPKKIRIDHLNDYLYKNRVRERNGVQFIDKDDMCQYYEVVNQEDGSRKWRGDVYTQRRNGRWIEQGSSMHGTGGIHLGRAENYRDPNF